MGDVSIPAVIPEVTRVERLRMEPGDVLVLRLDTMRVSEHDAHVIREKVRAVVGDVPVLIVGSEWSVHVVTPAGAGEPT